jgi:hypothetical protein
MLLRNCSPSTLACLLVFACAVASTKGDAAPTTRPSPPRQRSPSIFDDIDCARKVSFAVDASGSMIGKMASLKDQLNKAIVYLSPEQSFGLVFFQKENCARMNPELLPASAANKRKAGQFLEDVRTCGTTNPIPGIEAAFRQNPEVMYLVTDGDFPDNFAVLMKVRELNKEQKVKIYTIAFVGHVDIDTDFIKLLKTIAAENHGQYRHVNEGDL